MDKEAASTEKKQPLRDTNEPNCLHPTCNNLNYNDLYFSTFIAITYKR